MRSVSVVAPPPSCAVGGAAPRGPRCQLQPRGTRSVRRTNAALCLKRASGGTLTSCSGCASARGGAAAARRRSARHLRSAADGGGGASGSAARGGRALRRAAHWAMLQGLRRARIVVVSYEVRLIWWCCLTLVRRALCAARQLMLCTEIRLWQTRVSHAALRDWCAAPFTCSPPPPHQKAAVTPPRQRHAGAAAALPAAPWRG